MTLPGLLLLPGEDGAFGQLLQGSLARNPLARVKSCFRGTVEACRLLPKSSTLMASGWQTGQGHLRQPEQLSLLHNLLQAPASTLTSQAFPVPSLSAPSPAC